MDQNGLYTESSHPSPSSTMGVLGPKWSKWKVFTLLPNGKLGLRFEIITNLPRNFKHLFLRFPGITWTLLPNPIRLRSRTLSCKSSSSSTKNSSPPPDWTMSAMSTHNQRHMKHTNLQLQILSIHTSLASVFLSQLLSFQIHRASGAALISMFRSCSFLDLLLYL